MPSSSSRLPLKGLLSVAEIQKFIPKKWKQVAATKPVDTAIIEHPVSVRHSYAVKDGRIMLSFLVSCIKDHASQGNLCKAFETFSLLQRHALRIASARDCFVDSISCLLFSCADWESSWQGRQIHGHLISLGLDRDPVLVPKLVTFYTKFDFLIEAHSIVEDANIMHALPWNLLISAYVRNELYGKALASYTRMVSKGVRPDNFTYPSVLKACGEESDLGFGKEVHSDIKASRNGWSLFVQNSLISMYGKTGELGVARSLFDEMPSRDGVSWNAIISGYALKGMCDEALELSEKMQAEVDCINNITWNTVAGCFLRARNFLGVLSVLSKMRKFDVQVDSVAVMSGLSACSHIGARKLGAQLHGFAVCNGYDGLVNVRNALITMYSRCKDPRQAYVVFSLMETKTVVTWNSIISGYSYLDLSEEASSVFREMLLTGVEPNYVTIVSTLPICARVANLRHGKEFHSYVLKRPVFQDYLLIWNALVEMYARSGKLPEARRLFDSMNTRDEVTYTSLIAAYGVQGEGQTALQLFDEMNRCKIKPDHVTMVAVLSACSHSGLVTEGEILFRKMVTLYDIVPRLEHFDCMVDLFGRAGLLNRAKEIVVTMPYSPTPAIWATLIGACRIHGNKDIGEWAATHLLEMKPGTSGYYVLIGNMYADAGNWDKLAEVRTLMRNVGVKKAPGCASVDVGSGFRHFSVGGSCDEQEYELYSVLDGMTELMKDVGRDASEDVSSEDEALQAVG
ncbi:Pentatricopeptide repeat-containing protein At1g71490 [Linum perenne]